MQIRRKARQGKPGGVADRAREQVLDALRRGTVRDVVTALDCVPRAPQTERAYRLYRVTVLQVIGARQPLDPEMEALRRRWPRDVEVLGEVAEWYSDRGESARCVAWANRGLRLLQGRRLGSWTREHCEKVLLLKANAEATMGMSQRARKTLIAGLVRLPDARELANGLHRLWGGDKVWHSLFGSMRPNRPGRRSVRRGGRRPRPRAQTEG